MPRQILFIQGAGEAAHDQWDDKLVRSLKDKLGEGYTVRYPRMPNEADPRYATWKTMLLDELDDLEAGAVLVGHSVGGTILLHVLAEARPKVKSGALILIAPPFIGSGGWQSDDIATRTDFDLPAQLPVILYHGADDRSVPFAHSQLYAQAIPQAVIRPLPHRDHQLNNDLSEVAQAIRVLPQ